MTSPAPHSPANSPAPLTQKKRAGVWGAVIGSAIGSTSWLLAMAGMSGDWLTVGITVALAALAVYVAGSMVIKNPSSRFAVLGFTIFLLTLHCLAMFWWRLDLWRAHLNPDPAELLKQKKTITFALLGMGGVLYLQFLAFHAMMKRQKKQAR